MRLDLILCVIIYDASDNVYNVDIVYTGRSGSPGHVYNNSSCTEDVYRSLRRTTAEIQNYTHLQSRGLADVVSDTASKDSGISQMYEMGQRPVNGVNGHHRYIFNKRMDLV